jgi:hypothetical protein
MVLSGRIEIRIAELVLNAAAGDLVLFEAPYPEKTVVASDDFRAIWIGVPRRVQA